MPTTPSTAALPPRRRIAAAPGPAALAAPRGGFTLIELLVVIMILGILASITTFALWDAQNEARAARTRSQIQRIHDLLMIRWESYHTRPVPIRTTGHNPEQAAKLRLNAIRELMRMELPDRITDVQDGPVSLLGRPSLNLAYQRRVGAIGGFGNWSPQNQQAECLYLILASIQDGTRNGLDFFRESEIGDTDGDGMPEILDGWGRPIRFLRWAPGFDSPLQPLSNRTELQADSFDILRVDPRWKNNTADNRHYPDDRTGDYPAGSLPTGVDVTLDDPFQLYPLVFSAGPDGMYHVVVDRYGTTLTDDDYDTGGQFNGGSPLHYRNTNAAAYDTYNTVAPWKDPPYPPPAWPTKLIGSSPGWRLWTNAPPNDPYVIPVGCAYRIGALFGTGANDNLDNQSLVVR